MNYLKLQKSLGISLLLFAFISLTRPTFAQWIEKNIGLNGGNVSSLASSGTIIYAGTSKGLYKSSDNGETWSLTELKYISINSIELSGTIILVATNTGVYISNDAGESWMLSNNGLSTINVLSIKAINGNIFLGTSNDGAYLSNNGGQSWNKINNGLPSLPSPKAFVSSGSTVFVGLNKGEVYQTTNNGVNWTSVNSASAFPNVSLTSMVLVGSNLFAGVNDGFGQGGIYTLGLLGWENVNSNIFAGSSNKSVNHLTVTGSTLLAAGYGLASSTNGGATWTNFSTGIPFQYSSFSNILISGSNIYSGYSNGIVKSTDNGANWTTKSNGINNVSVNSVITKGSLLFAGSYYGLYTSSDIG